MQVKDGLDELPVAQNQVDVVAFDNRDDLQLHGRKLPVPGGGDVENPTLTLPLRGGKIWKSIRPSPRREGHPYDQRMDEPALIRCPACGKQNRVRPAAKGAPHCGACGAPLPWVTESSDTDFVAVVEQSDLPGLVAFRPPSSAPAPLVPPGPRPN